MKKYYGWNLSSTENAIDKMKSKHEDALKAVSELMIERIKNKYGIELELFFSTRQFDKPCFFVSIKIKKTLKKVFEVSAKYKQNEGWGFGNYFLGDFVGYVAECYAPQNANAIYITPLNELPQIKDFIELENILIDRLGNETFIQYLKNQIEL